MAGKVRIALHCYFRQIYCNISNNQLLGSLKWQELNLDMKSMFS